MEVEALVAEMVVQDTEAPPKEMVVVRVLPEIEEALRQEEIMQEILITEAVEVAPAEVEVDTLEIWRVTQLLMVHVKLM